MGSTRLPGKVLKPLAGIPLILRIVGRLQASRQTDIVIVATSHLPGDDVLAQRVAETGCPLFRGSEADVLDRYRACAAAYELDLIVRATGDNPFVDPQEGDRLIHFHRSGGYDYSNSFAALPIGVGLEVFSREALERSWRDGRAPHHREHVNEYVLENPQLFRCGHASFSQDKTAPGVRLTVDTPDDFAMAQALLAAYAADGGVGEPSTVWLVAAARRLGFVD